MSSQAPRPPPSAFKLGLLKVTSGIYLSGHTQADQMLTCVFCQQREAHLVLTHVEKLCDADEIVCHMKACIVSGP